MVGKRGEKLREKVERGVERVQGKSGLTLLCFLFI